MRFLLRIPHLPPAWRNLAAIGWFGFALLAGVAAAAEPRVLRVLAWPGYADADVVQAFEKRHGVRVELAVVASDTDLWERIGAEDGTRFDVFAVNTAELQRYLARDLVQTIDVALVPNTRRQLPRFRNLAAIPGLTRGDRVYGIPYTYAEMGLIYDRAQFTAPPESIAVLWDPKYKGRVIAYNGASHNISLAAQTMGARSPFAVPAQDWPKLVDRLIALRRNVLGFYTMPDEATQLFRNQQAAVLFANYGMQQVRLLQAAGEDVGYVIPREGALAWLDCWVITRGAKDPALAHAWIDYMLEDAVSGLLETRQGLASTIRESSSARDGDRLIWLEPVEDIARRERVWERVMSGDRAARVLAP